MLVGMTIDANLLKECCDAHGVSGHEGEVRNVFRRVLGRMGEVATAGAGNIVCERAGAWPRVMLAAHMDEIGFLVQSVGEDGFLSIVPIGGWWNHTLLSQKVVVKTRSGRKVRGRGWRCRCRSPVRLTTAASTAMAISPRKSNRPMRH